MLLDIYFLLRLFPIVLSVKYCIIGAGPGGVQIAYFLQKFGRDYVVFERSDHAGSFYDTYPRHRKLISINKRHTGSTNKEFNLRHDWNSLLGDSDKMLFKEFSKEMFPPAESFVQYINSYVEFYKLNIKYKTDIKNVRKLSLDHFVLLDQANQTHYCNVVIVGTGISVPKVPNVTGIELTEGYENISTNSSEYEGKSVLILGRGNSAFETAQAIYDRTSYVHMIGRQRIRLAWETHYVGDIRAVNNEILDTYQLKSLDGFLEVADLEDYRIVRTENGLYLTDNNEDERALWQQIENDPLQRPYDMVIRCLGFIFDTSVFDNKIKRKVRNKYPEIGHDYQSKDVSDLYVVGTATHSLDHRRSAGGFIHGFRYTARALYNILSWRYHRQTWPAVTYNVSQLVPVTVKRINEASGIYQMFGQLVDVIIISEKTKTFHYVEEFPLYLIFDFESISGISTVGKSMIVVALEYGEDYHGPSEDVFREDRAATEARYAHLSNFLHPVLYFYQKQPQNSDGTSGSLPRPDLLLHLVEDFHTNWHHNKTHVQHLKTFFEQCISQTLDRYTDDECLVYSLTTQTVPLSCKEFLISL